MTWFDAFILGGLQGLAEFLPISSSGHLAVFQHFFGRNESVEQDLFLNILLHFSTMLALLIYFKKDIAAVLQNFIFKKNKVHSFFAGQEKKLFMSLIISIMATASVGLILKKLVLDASSQPFWIGLCFILTALILWISRKLDPTTNFEGFSYRDALLIGIVQGIAVFPGLSRSGLTICMALFLGVERETSAKYSLFLSIPTIAAVALVEMLDLSRHDVVLTAEMILAMMVAGGVGYFAIHWILYFVKQKKFHYFSPYLLLLGILLFFV